MYSSVIYTLRSWRFFIRENRMYVWKRNISCIPTEFKPVSTVPSKETYDEAHIVKHETKSPPKVEKRARVLRHDHRQTETLYTSFPSLLLRRRGYVCGEGELFFTFFFCLYLQGKRRTISSLSCTYRGLRKTLWGLLSLVKILGKVKGTFHCQLLLKGF